MPRLTAYFVTTERPIGEQISTALRQFTWKWSVSRQTIHFLSTDPAVPEKISTRYAALGLCKDEFAETDQDRSGGETDRRGIPNG